MTDQPDGGRALRRAHQLVELGRYREALAVLGPLLAEQPDELAVLCLTAQTELALGHPEQAVQLAGRAVTGAPDDEWALRLLAHAQSRSDRHGEAVAAAQIAVAVGSGGWRAHVTLADVARRAPGQADLAWVAARTAVELAPHEPATHIALAEVATATKQFTAAKRSYAEALRLDPSSGSAHRGLGDLGLAQADPRASAEHYSRAMRANPHDVAASRNLTVAVALSLFSGQVALGAVLLLALPTAFGFADKVPPAVYAVPPGLWLTQYFFGREERAVRRSRHAIRRVLRTSRRLQGAVALMLLALAAAVASTAGPPPYGQLIWVSAAIALGAAVLVTVRPQSVGS